MKAQQLHATQHAILQSIQSGQSIIVDINAENAMAGIREVLQEFLVCGLNVALVIENPTLLSELVDNLLVSPLSYRFLPPKATMIPLKTLQIIRSLNTQPSKTVPASTNLNHWATNIYNYLKLINKPLFCNKTYHQVWKLDQYRDQNVATIDIPFYKIEEVLDQSFFWSMKERIERAGVTIHDPLSIQIDEDWNPDFDWVNQKTQAYNLLHKLDSHVVDLQQYLDLKLQNFLDEFDESFRHIGEIAQTLQESKNQPEPQTTKLWRLFSSKTTENSPLDQIKNQLKSYTWIPTNSFESIELLMQQLATISEDYKTIRNEQIKAYIRRLTRIQASNSGALNQLDKEITQTIWELNDLKIFKKAIFNSAQNLEIQLQQLKDLQKKLTQLLHQYSHNNDFKAWMKIRKDASSLELDILDHLRCLPLTSWMDAFENWFIQSILNLEPSPMERLDVTVFRSYQDALLQAADLYNESIHQQFVQDYSDVMQSLAKRNKGFYSLLTNPDIQEISIQQFKKEAPEAFDHLFTIKVGVDSHTNVIVADHMPNDNLPTITLAMDYNKPTNIVIPNHYGIAHMPICQMPPTEALAQARIIAQYICSTDRPIHIVLLRKGLLISLLDQLDNQLLWPIIADQFVKNIETGSSSTEETLVEYLITIKGEITIWSDHAVLYAEDVETTAFHLCWNHYLTNCGIRLVTTDKILSKWKTLQESTTKNNQSKQSITEQKNEETPKTTVHYL